MSFYNGILNLTNWAGNVIMPTLGALFIAVAVIQFARGYHNLYSTWAYGGLMCLMVSGLLRMFEKFTGQLGWNNPDLYWNSLLNLVDWFANVILPVYAGMHVAVGALKFGGLFEQQVHHQFNHTRHFLGAILCLMASGLLRLGEFFVTKRTAGVRSGGLRRCKITSETGIAHGTYSDTGSKEPGNEGDFSLSGILGFVRHPRPGRRDEHVRPILATRDVWYSNERVLAVRGSRVEYSGPHPIQVWETAWLPAGLADVSHEAARVLRTGVRLRTAHGIPERGILNATNAPPMGRFAAPARALRTTASPRLSRWLHHPHQRVLRSGL